MLSKTTIVLLPGDGVGPEVVAEARRVLELVAEVRGRDLGIDFDFKEELIGGCAIDATGNPLPDSTLDSCRASSAVLLGAVGGPQWPRPATAENPDPARPEQGLLRLRKELDLYANIRPCLFPGKSVIDRSSLKREVVEGTDIVFVRELTGGIYFGKREEEKDGEAYDTMTYSVAEVERITRVAASLSLLHNPPLPIVSIDKANVLATSRLWRRTVTSLLAREFPTIPLSHHLVDSAAMLLVMNPRKLNGIVLTENMFGDILSDAGSVLPGSLGLLPSASLNGWGKGGLGVYEPIHGSAPDIAGQGIANPIGTILSASMLLHYSLGLQKEARAIEAAVAHVLDVDMIRTRDLGGEAKTVDVGNAVLDALRQELAKI
ncbi:3-isopropylmalate dehydrogenase [Blyttiomyces helicus]|uniref:3-isopropylmalate dehydrogenase n=1 Tax=Blyttiomyces helicus TaxID=388810 RepID=A0A4V1IQP9_9FUNG|nr:3-isopropylmalate dehydrogenase [Blyttiomyces helicus]|eukprot:RKO87317.1 3-isopropylmalate dehydrogenase [Blyttiomyces helicus]